MRQPNPVAAEVLEDYFITAASCEQIAGGVNNTTCRVISGDERYVLRIYDNHAMESRVAYELELLDELQRQNLSFQIPAAVPNLKGNRLTRAANGKIAVLFRHIPGERPSEGYAYQVGRAAGELSVALGSVRVGDPAPYVGHFRIYEIHPAVTREAMREFLAQPADGWDRQALSRLERELMRLEMAVKRLAGLPQQLIHGDLLYGNVLAENGRITGILDFEFASPDIRAMEVAICVTQFMETDGMSPFAEPFLRGYGEWRRLSVQEVRALPLLLELRSMASFLHHFGRWRVGAAAAEPARKRWMKFIEKANWLQSREGELTVIRLGETYLL